MAGRVRQPIDVGALESWISKNVPQIEVPLDVKQVRARYSRLSPSQLVRP